MMNVTFFLYWTSFKNRLRKAVRRPVTYFYVAGVIGYFVMMAFSLSSASMKAAKDGNKWFFLMACFFTILSVASGLISYSDKKGLIFVQSDVHFLFQAPLNPKSLLLHANVRNLFSNAFVNLIFLLFGVFLLRADIYRIVIYVVLFYGVENILQASLMILVYGNETASESTMKIVRNFFKVLVGIFVLSAFYLIMQSGISLMSVREVLTNPIIQCIPLLGWIVAVLELIFVEASTVNIVCSILYGILLLVVFIMACREKCSGMYYEDAMKFADTYMEARKKKEKGETVFSLNKKQYKKAEVDYKGTGAKALFYRQLLEYKKSKWFIFGGTSLIHLLAGMGVVLYLWKNPVMLAGNNPLYLIGGVSAYVIMLLSGFTTKWQMELTSPYTFLIPDTSFRKLWYSSLIEHIRAFSNAVLIVVPGSLYAKISPINVTLLIIAFVCFSANKTYAGIVCEKLLGNLLGENAKTTLKVLLITTTLGLSFLGAVLANLIAGEAAALLAFILITILVTLILALLASLLYDKMERRD